MITLFLIIVLIVVNIGLWIFSTSTVVNGEHSQTAFIVKSIFYWASVILNVSIGILLMTI
jgi:uncharacterized membrane protein YqiK